MEITFNYIRNQIQKFRKSDLINKCQHELDRIEDAKGIWYIFIILKWSHLYGGNSYPNKVLTNFDFNKIYKSVIKFNDDALSVFIKDGRWEKVFHILYYQQFYLQRRVYKEIFATQLKLFCSIKVKMDINASFKEKTGLTIEDFIFLSQTMWIIVNAKSTPGTAIRYNGYISADHLTAMYHYKGLDVTKKFIDLLTYDPENISEAINKNSYGIRNESLQPLERTFFTYCPIEKRSLKVIHDSVLNYVFTYFIYDYMKGKDKLFSEEFGRRFERYVELGIKEIGSKYLNEKEIKNSIHSDSKLVDFILSEENVLIECKAIELQAYPSVNPSDEQIYNALKDSIIKAYAKQMTQVINSLKLKSECFGLIITYKEFFWSKFADLWELAKKDIDINLETTFLPPENVYIIDILTWDKMVQIVKNKKTTISQIVKRAKEINSIPRTSKQLFSMILDEYELMNLDLSYLKDELKILNTYNKI